MRLIFATGNSDKMNEIREILKDLDMEMLSLKEAGITSDPEENGATFAENALIKAKAAWEIAGDDDTLFMADDSGLEVDAMNKEPGVYSARFMGHETSYHEKNAEIIRRLENVPGKDRTARFRCAVACVLPDGEELVAEGTIEGRIGYEEKGDNGFGYDPIFCLPDMSKTTAELSPEEKNAISHRGQALRNMLKLLKEHEILNKRG